jgi:hypothetical protein
VILPEEMFGLLNMAVKYIRIKSGPAPPGNKYPSYLI